MRQELDKFESEIFGFTVGRIDEVRSFELTPGTIDGLKRNYDMTLARVSLTDHSVIRGLTRGDFELMDVGLTFERSTKVKDLNTGELDIEVGVAHPGDVEQLVPMLVDPWGGRYDEDEHLDRDKVAKLRLEWLKNDLAGRTKYCFIAVDTLKPWTKGGFKIMAYVLAKDDGEIDLVGTLPDYRGQGIASDLLLSSLHEMRQRDGVEQATVRTHATNYAACRLYESTGFKLHKSDATFRLAGPRFERRPL
jgi:ribosomal protein S18 acetylase RimI-like enzyme